MLRLLFIIVGILFLSLKTEASFNDKTASDITGTHRMTAIDFRIAVNKLSLGEFNNFNIDKQNAIRERAQKAGISLPFETSIGKAPSKKTEILSKQMPQKIIPKLLSNTPESNTNVSKEKSVSNDTNNNQLPSEEPFRNLHHRYETLNNKAPQWFEHMDEKINQSAALIASASKEQNQTTASEILVKCIESLKLIDNSLIGNPIQNIPNVGNINDFKIKFNMVVNYYKEVLSKYKEISSQFNIKIKQLSETVSQLKEQLNKAKNADKLKALRMQVVLEKAKNELKNISEDPIFKMLDTSSDKDTSEKITANEKPSLLSSDTSLNELKKESTKQNENQFENIENMLKTYHEKYEFLNHQAPIWIQQMDEYLNKISSLMNDVAKSVNETNTQLTENEKLNKPLDENIKRKFTHVADMLRIFNEMLPGKPEYGFPDLAFSETHNNIGILFSKAKAYYIFTLARYKKTALELNTALKSMYEKLNQFGSEYENARESKNSNNLQTLEKAINIELEKIDRNPLFKLNKK